MIVNFAGHPHLARMPNAGIPMPASFAQRSCPSHGQRDGCWAAYEYNFRYSFFPAHRPSANAMHLPPLAGVFILSRHGPMRPPKPPTTFCSRSPSICCNREAATRGIRSLQDACLGCMRRQPFWRFFIPENSRVFLAVSPGDFKRVTVTNCCRSYNLSLATLWN